MSSKTLPYCCEHGLKEEVIALLAKGEDVNQKDGSSRYPLHYAAIGGYVEIVSMLLQKGAIVNCATPRGATPLHYASRGGRIECIQLLIDNNADVNCKDSSGNTPLHTALVCNETKCAISLIETFGADVNLINSDGSTPLHLASARGLTKVIISLLENGAKFDIRDSKENSPFVLLPITEEKRDQKQYDNNLILVQDISKLFNINKNRELSGVNQEDSNSNSSNNNNNNNNNDKEDDMKIDKKESTDKLYSDITFLIENQKVYAHKCIVQIRCPNFMNSISNNNSNNNNNNNNIIEIKDTTFKLFLSFIEYIYTGTIEKFESVSKSIDLSFQFSVLLFAEKFDFQSLINYCKDFICKNIGESNAGSIWSCIKKLSFNTRSNPIISSLIRDCLITLTKGWNIFASTKTFSNDINKFDVIEIIKTLAPLINEIQISELKPARANTNQSTSQSKTAAKSNRMSTTPQTTNTSSSSTTTTTTPSKSSSSSKSQSTPSSSSSSSSSSAYSESMNEKNLTFCKSIISGMFKKKTSLAFQRPVDPQAEGIPDYFDVIKQPMDLSTIKSKLDGNKYSNIKEFAADVRLMFENALIYNAESSPIWKYAHSFLTAFDQKFVSNFPNEKIPVYKSPAPIPAPVPQQQVNNNNSSSTPSTDKKRKLESEQVRVKEDSASSAQPSSSNNNYTNGENASSSSSSSSSKSSTQAAVAATPVQKKYTDDERRSLMERINELAPEDVQNVLNIIDPNAIKQADESLEIDMYQIDDKNLSQVEAFINDCFKKQKQI